MFATICETITKIKQEQPLILNITNDVTMEFVANGLLSLRALPVTSKSIHELEDLIKLARAVVINMGTLDDAFMTLCVHACRLANQHNKPIVLDPVGAGASMYRTDSCLRLLRDHRIAILRANVGEIIALNESESYEKEAIESARHISARCDATVVISGEKDFVIDYHQVNQFQRGSNLMTLVTGTGSLLSAVIGAFHAVFADRFEAASAATLFYSVCGELAERKSKYPGSFKTFFIDVLHKVPMSEDYKM